MKLSIVIPCYNVEQYLAECLDSVFAQRFDGLEVIAIDDGSPDHCIDILREYEARYPEIMRVISRENRGLSTSRNEGIALSTGEYVCVLDSDDLYAADILRDAWEICRANDLDVLALRADTFSDPEPHSCESLYSEASALDGSISEMMTGYELLERLDESGTYRAESWLLMTKRAFLAEKGIRYMDGITYEGGPYTLEVYLKAGRAMLYNRVFVHYRQREDSITHMPVTARKVYSLLRTLIRFVEIYEESAFRGQKSESIFKRMETRRRIASRYFGQLDEAEREAFFELCDGRDMMYFRLFLQPDEDMRARLRPLRVKNNRLKKQNLKLEEENTQLREECSLRAEKNRRLRSRNAALRKANRRLKEKLAALEKELQTVQEKYGKILAGASYRIGKVLTAPMRKLRDLLRA